MLVLGTVGSPMVVYILEQSGSSVGHGEAARVRPSTDTVIPKVYLILDQVFVLHFSKVCQPFFGSP